MTEQQSHKSDIWSEIASNLVDELATTRATIATQKGKLNDTWDALVKAENNVTNLIKLVAMREQEVADLTAKLAQRDQICKQFQSACDGLNEELIKKCNENSQLKSNKVQWHDASEQPERWPVLVERDGIGCYDVRYVCITTDTVRWCYIDEVK